MSKTYLFIDSNNSARRAYHAVGKRMLEEGEFNGTTFAFLREVGNLVQKFQPDRVVFCFDLGRSKRFELLECYKSGREERIAAMSYEEKSAEFAFRVEVRSLRQRVLPAIGYRNVFAAKGCEADDLIADLCIYAAARGTAVIASSDKDLYQCLQPVGRVTHFSPHGNGTLTDWEGFHAKYGITPHQWVDVKAICGEGPQGDNIPGVPGVGEKTALKFVRGELPTHHKTYKAILAHRDLVQKNYDLVRLPFPGTPPSKVRKDEITRESWMKVTEGLGFAEELERYAPPRAKLARR